MTGSAEAPPTVMRHASQGELGLVAWAFPALRTVTWANSRLVAAAVIAASTCSSVVACGLAADHSYQLDFYNDSSSTQRLKVGFDRDLLSVPPKSRIKVADVQDETVWFPVVVQGQPSRCFPQPFYQARAPHRTEELWYTKLRPCS